MFHGHVELLVLITPLGWVDLREVVARDLPTVRSFGSHICFDTLELVKCRFSDIDAVSGYPETETFSRHPNISICRCILNVFY